MGYKSKVKLATIVEGNPKAPFSIATTTMCRGGRYSFPGLLYFTLDPYLIMLSVKQGGIKYHFLSLWYDSTWDWTQVSRAIGEHSNPYIYIYIYRNLYQCWRGKDELIIIFFSRPLLLDVPVLADQWELMYISSARTPGVFWKTSQDRWTIWTDRKRVRKNRTCSVTW